ncbi:MAG: hypothetical protein R3E97_18320 [Candidatus Eisenbacteria bacterium]
MPRLIQALAARASVDEARWTVRWKTAPLVISTGSEHLAALYSRRIRSGRADGRYGSMKRLTSIAVGFCMMAFAATASANLTPVEQDPCGDDNGCGGVIHHCHCTVLDRCPCGEVDLHGIVVDGIPVPSADEPQQYEGEYWVILLAWLATLVE